MADNELNQQEEVAGTEVSTETAPPADQTQQVRQPATAVNLDELPEGRALKSTYDKRIAALERERESERLARMAAEQAADAVRMEQMTNEEKLQLQLQRAQEHIRTVEQERQQDQEMLRRERDIDKLSSESGAPRDEIAKAETYADAVAIALTYAKKAARAAEVREAERDPATDARNAVDLGGSGPPPPTDDWEARRLELLASGDATAYMAHIMGTDEE